MLVAEQDESVHRRVYPWSAGTTSNFFLHVGFVYRRVYPESAGTTSNPILFLFLSTALLDCAARQGLCLAVRSALGLSLARFRSGSRAQVCGNRLCRT